MQNLRKRDFKDGSYGQLARIGKALSSPKRLELLDLLCQADWTVEVLAGETAMSVANTSQHLQVLEASRLVQAKKQGRFVHYSLADALVSDFFRVFRVLGDDRIAELEQIRRRFLQDNPGLQSIDRETLIRRVRSREVVVIDVRPVKEYRAAHIPGALAIPLGELKRRLAELPRRKEIVAYCRGPYCVLAFDAVQQLRAHGFRAYRMEDSIQDWRAHGLPVATGEEPKLTRGDRSLRGG